MYLLIFRVREREGEEGERNIHVWLPLTRPLLETWPATQACALTGNRTGNPLVHRPVQKEAKSPPSSSPVLLIVLKKVNVHLTFFQ